MSDITLVNSVFPTDVKVPPQGLLYLTSSLEAAGYSVELRDYQHCPLEEPWSPHTFARFVEGGARVLGVSCMSYALPLVIAAAPLIKRQEPERFIVLGGIGPSPVARALLEFCPAIDAVVMGEGERTAVELMDALRHGRDLSTVEGLAWREGREIRINRARARIGTIDRIPRPAYGRVELSRYRMVDIQFGRGCPYDCAFCDIAPYWGRRHTRRPVEDFLDELEQLVRGHGARDIFFIDDTFVLSREHVRRICEGIRERRLDFRWGCYARVDLMDESLMEQMATAGCTKIFYGIESGSDAVLTQIDKGITHAQNTETVRKSLEYFPFVTTSFVWGFPEESFEALEETVCTLLYFASLGACPQLNLALPYSYSPLYRGHREQLIFSPEHSSQLRFYQGTDRAWLEQMLGRSAELFSAFYRLPTPDFERKWDYLREVGLDPHTLQDAYFENPLAA